MFEIERTLARRLRRRRVRLEAPDGNTVLLRDVPANRTFYNKSATNLLLKRLETGMPFLVCVDEDLEYVGTDQDVRRVFTGSVRREGWRTLHLGLPLQTDLQQAVTGALDLLGFDGHTPAVSTCKPTEEVELGGDLDLSRD